MKRGGCMSNERHCVDHSGCITKIEHIEKQVHLNTTDIKTVGEAVIRLTAILEMMQKTSQTATKAPFMDAETKKLLIKWGFALIIVLIIALTGTNIIEGLQALSSVK
jgi:hypothetical protein